MDGRILGSLLVFLGAASYGILSSIVKTTYSLGYTLGQVTVVQTFFGALALWALWFFSRLLPSHPQSKIPQKRSYLLTAIMGIFLGLVNVLYYKSVQLLPASIAIILLMQYLWISFIIDFILYRNRPIALQYCAITLILIGGALAAGLFQDGIVFHISGYIYGLLAAICYAIFIATSDNVAHNLAPLQKSALMMSGACTLTVFLFPPRFVLEFSWHDPLYLFGIALAFLGTALPTLLFSIGIPKIGIRLAAILSAAELPVAVLTAYFYLNESVRILQWTGVIVIMLSIILPHLHTIRTLITRSIGNFKLR